VNKADPQPDPVSSASPHSPQHGDIATDFCENCGETRQLAKVKGCIRCLRCGFKADCSGM
jgi:hypothetical protein